MKSHTKLNITVKKGPTKWKREKRTQSPRDRGKREKRDTRWCHRGGAHSKERYSTQRKQRRLKGVIGKRTKQRPSEKHAA